MCRELYTSYEEIRPGDLTKTGAFLRQRQGTAVCRGGQAIPNIRANLGPGDYKTRPNAGNPINIGTSNKFQEVLDIPLRGITLTWSRFYNSGMITSDEKAVKKSQRMLSPTFSRMGSRWRGFYDRVVDGADNGSVRLTRHTWESNSTSSKPLEGMSRRPIHEDGFCVTLRVGRITPRPAVSSATIYKAA